VNWLELYLATKFWGFENKVGTHEMITNPSNSCRGWLCWQGV